MRKFHILFLVLGFLPSAFLSAAPLAVGTNLGVDFPLSKRSETSEGFAVEGLFRKDPYEIRFHFSDTKKHLYSLSINRKHFFSQSDLRPYFEAGIGPVILDSPNVALAYGLGASASLGVEMGVSDHFSVQILTRYQPHIVFGDTVGGSWETNHMIALMGGVSLWF